jgi:glycine cleavage system aminomethyltransferase T
MTYENNAYEMGLERLVNLDALSDEACISAAAYRRIAAGGANRRINGVRFDGEPFPELNNVKWAASIDSQEVGMVTSAIYSPRLAANIGFCWLPAAASREGQLITVATEWGERAATVVEMPFVDPAKSIPVS